MIHTYIHILSERDIIDGYWSTPILQDPLDQEDIQEEGHAVPMWGSDHKFTNYNFRKTLELSEENPCQRGEHQCCFSEINVAVVCEIIVGEIVVKSLYRVQDVVEGAQQHHLDAAAKPHANMNIASQYTMS